MTADWHRSLRATGRALVGAGVLESVAAGSDPDSGPTGDGAESRLEESIARADGLVDEFLVSQPAEIAAEPENERIGRTEMQGIADTCRELGFRRVDEIFLTPPGDPAVTVVTGACERAEFVAGVGGTGRSLGGHGQYGLYYADALGTIAVSDRAVVARLHEQTDAAVAELRAFITGCERAGSSAESNPLRELLAVLPPDYDDLWGGRHQREEACRTLGVDPDAVLAGASTRRTEGGTAISTTAAVFESEAAIDIDAIRATNQYARHDFDEPYSVSQHGRVVTVEKRRETSVYGDGLFDRIKRLLED